jgi:hypothetical protein
MLSDLRITRCLLVAALLAFVSGCGGGGGDSSTGTTGTTTQSGPTGSYSVSPTSLTITATTADPAPIGTVTVTVQLQGATSTTEVYAVGTSTHSGIDSLSFGGSGPDTGVLQVTFKAPAALGAGTFTDTITLQMCFDSKCAQPLSGGPVTITTHYSITAVPTVSVASTTVNVAATTADASAPVDTVALQVVDAPAGGVYITASSSTTGIKSVTAPSGAVPPAQASVVINFAAPSQLGEGTYTDQVQINVCADAICETPLAGSPLLLNVTYTVTSPKLATTRQTGLSHDVIDAKYSRALDAIIMVSSYPTNALYLYDIATQKEYTQPLNKLPTAVTVGPTGLDAAVGHDALITYVNLSTLKQATPPAPVQLTVSAPVFDLVLDGHGNVHAVPAVDQWVSFHSVNIATNVETVSNSGQLWAGSHAKLQPGTTYIYTADNGLDPSSMQKWDVSSGSAAYLYEMFGATYPVCGNLWFSDDTVTIYTPCGNVFRASATQAQDMAYSGQLVLMTALYGDQLVSVDESTAGKEILGIEESLFNCGPNGTPAQCQTDVVIYDSTYLGLNGLYSLPAVALAGQSYPQRGLFVFHSADGTQRFLISMLYGEPNPATQYYISTF